MEQHLLGALNVMKLGHFVEFYLAFTPFTNPTANLNTAVDSNERSRIMRENNFSASVSNRFIQPCTDLCTERSSFAHGRRDVRNRDAVELDIDKTSASNGRGGYRVVLRFSVDHSRHQMAHVRT